MGDGGGGGGGGLRGDEGGGGGERATAKGSMKVLCFFCRKRNQVVFLFI